MTTTLTGRDAIEFARAHKLQLRKYADPIDGAREVSGSEAEEVVLADPQLIYLTLPWARVEQTATGAILWEGACDSARAALSALEEMAGAPEGGWGDGVAVHEYWLDADGAPIARTTPASEVPAGVLGLVEAELKRLGVYDEGEGGVVVGSAVDEYHVTDIRNGDVYGHLLTRCDDAGCAAGTEMFLGPESQFDECEVGGLVEVGVPTEVVIGDENVSGRYFVADLLPLLRRQVTDLESYAPADTSEDPASWAYGEFWQAIDPAEVKEDEEAEKIQSLRGNYSIEDAENALVAAFRPFGSLKAAGAEPDEHERKLAKAVLAWVSERPIMEVGPIQSLLQLLWSTDADQFTLVGEVAPYSVELITPTSGTRIRCERDGRLWRAVSIKFGDKGSRNRAGAILANAKTLGVSFQEVVK